MMSISAKVDYAVLAMLTLAAEHASDRPVTLREMSALGIPQQFLAQIFQQLKAAGLVRSLRGSTGGYRLRKSPASLTIFEIVDAVESPSDSPPALGRRGRAVHSLWKQIADSREAILRSTTLNDLVRAAEGSTQPMYYI